MNMPNNPLGLLVWLIAVLICAWVVVSVAQAVFN